MKIIKAETYLKPLPESMWDRTDNTVTIYPILENNTDVPDDDKFLFRPRSYVVGVFAGQDSWFDLKMDRTGEPLVFTLPSSIVDNTQIYTIFAAYNDGFLGGSFSTGFYSLKEKVQYWYTKGKTIESVDFNRYFIAGPTLNNAPVIIDFEKYLVRPIASKWVYYRIGDPITIGQYGVIIGRKHEPWTYFRIGVTPMTIGQPSLSFGSVLPEEQESIQIM